MADYSLAEVESSLGAPKANGPKEYSLEDVESTPKHQTDAQIAWGGVKASGRAIAQEGAALGDMVLGVPGGAASSIGELLLRAGLSADKDTSGKAASAAGREFREHIAEKGSPTWFTDLVNKMVPPGEDAEPSHVAKAMTWLQGKIDQGGDAVEKATGGALTRDDASMFANGFLNMLGLKATMKGGVKLEGKIKEKLEEKKAEKPSEPPEEKPYVYPTPEAAVDPRSRAQMDIERSTGIEGAEKRAEFKKKTRAEARKAFGDDAKYTAYLNEHVKVEVEEVAPAVEPPKRIGAVDLAQQFKDETGHAIETAGVRIAGAEVRGESSPYTPAQEALFNRWEAMRYPSSKYLYHTTPKENLAAIKEGGLTPGVKARHEGVSSPTKISLAANEEVARSYGVEGDALLRVDKNHPMEDLQPDLLAGGEGAYTTPKAVPPEALEVKQGRKWVPLKQVQLGGATLDTMKGIAAVSLGGVIGANLDKDNPIEGALLGAIGGAGIITGAVPKVVAKLKDLNKVDDRVRVNDLTNRHEHELGQAARAVWQVQQKIIDLVPSRARREALHNAIDAEKVGALVGKEAEAARLAQSFYEQIGKVGQDAKVLDETRDNYTTHLWKTADEAKLAAIMEAKKATPFSASSRFAQGRTHVTLEEGKAAGLKPLTEDLAEVIGLYGNSLSRAIANRRLVDSLKKAKTEDGQSLLALGKKAPPSFSSIETPSLNGWKVHPDIAPSLKFVMEANNPGAIVASLTALNTALKRNVVSLSLFHAKALTDAALGAVNNPLKVGKMVGQAALPKLFGQNRYLKMLKEGGAGDLVDQAYKDGLKFSFERGESAVEDVGGGFYDGMKILQNTLDKAVPGLGKPIAAYSRVNHAVDNFMWGRLHAGMKLEVYAAKVEALMENSAKRGKALTRDQAGEIAARYANDVFGGLNWRRLAEGARTKWGRDLSLAMLSPKGRMGLQLLMFAPDWTLSTSRAFFKAFGKGSGLKGLVSASAEADLYRQQLARSALFYVAIGDGLNYANSGHHLWENKDPFRVDLGDGRAMAISKHFTEPFELLRKPGQTALNKLGLLPKEGLEQAMGVEYLSAQGKMPPMQSPVRHALGNAVPIGVKPLVQGEPAGAQRSISSSLGAPIYGHTAKEKRQIAFEQAKERYKKSVEEMIKGKQQ